MTGDVVTAAERPGPVYEAVDRYVTRLPSESSVSDLGALVDLLDSASVAGNYDDLKDDAVSALRMVLSESHDDLVPSAYRGVLRLALLELPLQAALAERRSSATLASAARLSLCSSPRALCLPKIDPIWPSGLLDIDGPLGAVAAPLLQRWLAAFFVAEARADETVYACEVRSWAEARIERWLLDEGAPFSSLVVDAALALGTWSARYGVQDADEVFFHLGVFARDQETDPRVRARAARFAADPQLGRGPHAVPDLRHAATAGLSGLPVVERLWQLGTDPDAWDGVKESVLADADVIAELRNSPETVRGQQAFDSGRTRPVVETVAALAEAGNHAAALELLSRAFGIGTDDQLDDAVFAVAASRSTVWCHVGRTTTQAVVGVGLANLLDLLHDALRRSHGDSQNEGTFDKDLAHKVTQDVPRYLVPKRLEDVCGETAPEPRPLIVPLPWTEIPMQAAMVQSVGWTAPISLSLRRPVRDRTVRRVLLWSYGLLQGGYEEEALEIVFGPGVEITKAHTLTEDALTDAWEQGDFDVLWFAAHGGFKPDGIELDLNLGPDFSGGIEFFGSLDHPVGDRRLIVLNACDSGVASNAGGLGGIGLAAAIASPHQAVVAHLWPTDSLASAAFGAFMARGLAADAGLFQAFEAALRELVRDRAQIARSLGNLSCDRLAGRFEPSPVPGNPVDEWTFAEWGSPCFFA